MRWLVQVSSVAGSDRSDSVSVEAPNWRTALEQARETRGEPKSIRGFLIEVRADVFQAIDPTLKRRYEVRPEPGAGGTDRDAAATSDFGGRESAVASTEPAHRAGRSTIETFPPPLRGNSPDALGGEDPVGGQPGVPRDAGLDPAADTEPMRTPLPPPSGAPFESLSVERPTAMGEPSVEVAPITYETTKPSLEAPREPDFWLVGRREENWTEASPITYREYVYAVEPGTPTAEAEMLLWSRFREVQGSIRDCEAGKFVQLAVYDHVFRSQPVRPPIATLVWKDWDGDASVRFPGSVPPPAPDVGSSRTARSRPPPAESVLDDSETSSSIEELVTAWQEDLKPLAQHSGARAGAQVILEALGRRIPCQAYLVESFDTRTAEFVVIAARGPHVDHALGFRTPERQSPFPSLVQRGAAQAFDAGTDFDYVRAERWRALGFRPAYGLCGLVRLNERLLGAIELADRVEGGPFTREQTRAVDFLCHRFAQYLRARPNDFE